MGRGNSEIVTTRFNIHRFDELDSTQSQARQWVGEGRARSGDVITAKRQTAGYGRRGRGWDMIEGNLAATWIEDFSESRLSWIGFAASLGLYDAFKNYLPESAAVTLKWPNDVLIDGGKASGILIEKCGDKFLVGVGVNLVAAPQADQKTASMGDFMKQPPGPDLFLETFLSGYERWFGIGDAQGFAGLRRDWLVRAHQLNAPVTARLADGRVLTGIFADLDPLGALLLNTQSGLEKVTTADIFITENHDKKAYAG